MIALGLGTYVQAILPGTSTLLDALVCLALTTVCGLLSVQTNALITGAFLALELVALVIISIMGFANPAHPWLALLADPVLVDATGRFVPATLSNIALGTSAAVFAFYGFGSAIYLGEETHGASRHVARAVLWALVISVVSMSIPLTALLHASPLDPALFRSDTMFGDFVFQRGGPVLAMAMNLMVALAIINANIAIVILASRMLFSTGRDRVWPRVVNDALVRIHSRHKAPWVATIVTGTLAGLLCFVEFELLLIASGTALMVVYGFLCVAAIMGRRNGMTAHAEYRMPLFPWPPILALAAFGYIIFTNVTDPATGLASFLATAVVLIASSLYYQFILKRRGAWALRGPAATTPTDPCHAD